METATDKTEALLCPVTPFWELSDQPASRTHLQKIIIFTCVSPSHTSMKFKSQFLCSICGLGEIYSVPEYTLLYFRTSGRHINITAINYVVSGSLG